MTYVCSVVVDPSLAVIHAYEPGAAAYGAETRRGNGPWYGSSAGNDRTLLGPASCTASPERERERDYNALASWLVREREREAFYILCPAY